jgi:pSer/pThr/pTyr-binding forkhead associated (FHA) protein
MTGVLFECTAGESAGRKIRIVDGQRLIIGRTEAAEWTFPHDREMSSRHFAVSCGAGGCAIQDLNSTNGTYVNGVRVVDALPENGAEIRAGRTLFRVTVEGAAPTGTTTPNQVPPDASSESNAEPAAVPNIGPDAIQNESEPPQYDDAKRVADSQNELNESVPPVVPTTAVDVNAGMDVGLVLIHVLNGPQTGRAHILRVGQSQTFGATQTADIAIPGDPYLSGQHFELLHNGDHCQIRDLKSTSGVWLNDVRVRRARLRSGDVILAGRTRFQVELEWKPRDPATGRTPAERPSLQDTESSPPSAGDLVEATPAVIDAALEIPLLELQNQTCFAAGMLPWINRNGETRLTVVVKATYELTAQGKLQVAAAQRPLQVGDKHYRDDPLAPVEFETELVPFKPLADIVLVGNAWPAQGQFATQVDVRLRVGHLTKVLRVIGDRHWSLPTYLNLVPTISTPKPFESMPITYDRAFGGIDPTSAAYCAENPQGTGYIGIVSPKSVHGKKLPNIEDPQHLIIACDTRPRPVGFGFYGRGWQPRLRYAGTYDERYQKERAPLPPLDFSNQFYNGAHPDLQVEGYLQGGEYVELENLSREGIQRFSLPTVFPRIALTRFDAADLARTAAIPGIELDPGLDEDDPIVPVLDTLVMIPDQRQVYLVYRAVFALADLENIDIARIRVFLPDGGTKNDS